MNHSLEGLRARIPLAILLTSALVCAACSSGKKVDHYLQPFEEALGTDSDLDREFHAVATDPQGPGLRMPGYLVGFEKTERDRIGVPGLDDDTHLNATPGSFERTELKKFQNRMDDSKRIFLSHAAAYRLESLPTPYIRTESIYDAYSDGSFDRRRGVKPGHAPAAGMQYEGSWKGIELVRNAIAEDLVLARKRGERFTHIVVGSMGWNNRQLKSLRNLNSLFGNLCLAAKDC